MSVQTGKTMLQWNDDSVVRVNDRLSKVVTLEVPVVNGTEAVLLTITDLHNQDNPSPLPCVWFTDPAVIDDDVVAFTIQLTMGADTALLAAGLLEVAEVNWVVFGVAAP